MRTCSTLFFFLLTVASASAQWTKLPPDRRLIGQAMYLDDSLIVVATLDSGIVRSRDNVRWDAVNTGLPSKFAPYALHMMNGYLYLGTDSGAFRSPDLGLHWAPVAVEYARTRNVYNFLAEGAAMFIAADFGVFRSVDGGATWDKVFAGLNSSQRIYSLGRSDRYLFAGTSHAGVRRSSDGGSTWSEANNGLDVDNVSVFNFDGDFGFAGVGTGLHITLNGSDTWQWLGRENYGSRSFTQILRIGSVYFLGASEGILKTADSAKTFVDINDGFIRQTPIVGMGIRGNMLYICSTGEWIWRRPLSELLPPSSVEDAAAGMRATTLGAAVPNPASNHTRIPYNLAAAGPVELALYNTLGQRVAVVTAGEQQAGPHTATLDAGELPNGMYYYRLSAGSTTRARSLLVAR